MKSFVLVSEEELYSVQGRGGSSSSSSSGSSGSSGGSSYSKPKVSSYISAPYNAMGSVNVTTYTPGEGGKSYTVTGTTYAKAYNAKPEWDGKPYTPVPVPKGTYNVSTTVKPDVAGFGPGYNIQTSVDTKLDKGGVVAMNDNYVHATKYNNTFGCLGIITDPSKGGSASAYTRVSNTIANSDTVQLTIR